jgi:DNA-directed RNA polymerase specialized sigma24 family protein
MAAFRARALSRQIFASLPWGFRLANLFLMCASDAAGTLGRTAYALFVAAAVRNMPPVDGRDALDLVAEILGPQDADKLPLDYGRVFGGRLFRSLLAKFGPDLAEEATAETLMKLARGKVHVRNGASLAEAEALVATVAINAARDLARREQRRRQYLNESGDQPLDVEDPEAFAAVERALSPSDMARVLHDLEKIHPRARSFAEALLNGDSKTEIAEDWSVTPSYVSKWFREHKSDFLQVLQKHMREAARRYSYDRGYLDLNHQRRLSEDASAAR